MGRGGKSTPAVHIRSSSSFTALPDRDPKEAMHTKHGSARTSGSCFRMFPMLISLLLFVWSIAVYRRASSGNDCTISPAYTAASWQSNEQGSFGRTLQQAASLIGSEAGAASFMGMSNRRVLVQRDYHTMTMTIFCAPKPYNLEDPGRCEQRRALLSWLRLQPIPKVVLMGDDPTFAEIVRQFPEHVSVESKLDYNFRGLPQFHSMVARAQSADTDLSMIINGDIILLNDLFPAVQRVATNFPNWVLTAARWDLGEHFPFDFGTDRAKDARTAAAFDAEIKEFVHKNGSLHTYGGVDFWLWNNSPVPLFSETMPPFTFGRSKYDNWFTHEVIEAGLREVVDASLALTNVHVAHSYEHINTLQGANGSVAGGKNFWSSRKKNSWEMYNNIHLAETFGSYTNQKGTALHVPWKLASCYEPLVGNICLQKRLRPANCSCEYSSTAEFTQSDPKLVEGNWTCGKISLDKTTEYKIEAAVTKFSKPGLPHTMDQLLPQVAKEVDGHKVVILVAVTYGYAEMLMNFICRLRLLGLADNLVVAALDEDLYTFAFNQGIAVYYEQISNNLKKLNDQDCAFGSQCFRKFTKLKSRAVLKVLKAGYSVLWTDVDIVWYTDPLPHLMSFGPGTFPIQSNEPNASTPGTGIRRINSGFYFARSDPKTIEAFEAIVEHASHTRLSEQPSFYDVLCGERGERLLKKKEECKWSNGLRTIFLDRSKYPNGAVHDLWLQKDVTTACAKRNCAILHNNWIAGKDAKKDRLVENGYWHYDSERRMCMHDWHAKVPGIHRKPNPAPAVVPEPETEATVAEE